jgi:hypothetical protein
MLLNYLEITITIKKEKDRGYVMKRTLLLSSVILILILPILPSCSNFSGEYQNGKSNANVQPQSANNSEVEITRGRGGRGGIGITPRRPIDGAGYRAPATRPAPAPGRGLGFWGGFGLGALFGSILNPFSGAYGLGFSLVGLLFWAIILFFVYKLFRKFFFRTRI